MERFRHRYASLLALLLRNLELIMFGTVDNYAKLCTVEMDLSHLPIIPRAKSNGETGNYWYLEYTYILFFSAVELRAQISWVEKGFEKRYVRHL